MTLWSWGRKLLSFAVLAASVVGAACHGMMTEPAARNVVHNSNYCPHCLAAGGPGLTFEGGRVWPNSKHGVCGDPWNSARDHEAGGKFATKKITGTYAQGATIPIKIKISAPHGGRFSFGVCPITQDTDAGERAAVTQACFDDPRHRLSNAEDGTYYWWFGKKGVGEYTMNFKLPPGITCTRCVLQWHYESGNSCEIPGTPPQHSVDKNLVPCDKTGAMEEFWNCADVSIGAGGGPTAAPAAPKPPRKTAKPKAAAKPRAVEGFRNDDGHYGYAVNGNVVAVVAVASVALAALPLALALGAGALTLVFLAARQPRAPGALPFGLPFGPARRERFALQQAPRLSVDRLGLGPALRRRVDAAVRASTRRG